MSEVTLRGVAAAAGVAVGPAVVYRPHAGTTAVRQAGTPGQEASRFRKAVAAVDQDLGRLAEAADEHAREIVEAHRMMLNDPSLHELVEAGLGGGQAAESAAEAAIEQFAAMLEGLDDPYLRERAADVRDVGRRLAAAIAGATVGLKLEYPCVVIARDLAPTDTIGLDRSLLLGFVTEQGGTTSHTCILARSWGIPAVVATPGLLAHAQEGMTVALDGVSGEVVLAPSVATSARYDRRLDEVRVQATAALAEAGLPARTPDGHRVELAANAGSPADVIEAMTLGAEGIGLLRSEFLFMGRETAPTEEEQVEAYSEALRQAGGHRVVIRTLDIGGDKEVPYLGMPKEENPFLGVRALRLCFQRPELFQTQLRALLRAGVHGRLAIMFPMVSGLTELRQARAALDEARRSLAAEGIPHLATPEVGIMIEIPSAALLARQLAQEVDFFSIGTNDLVQYTLAVDRGNPELAGLYQPCHPAVLRLISEVVEAAHAGGRWVGVCGEMGGLPAGALLLLGLGVDELSVSRSTLPAIRRLIRATPVSEARMVARQALGMGTPEEVGALVAPLLDR